jgi:putative DNA methylase
MDRLLDEARSGQRFLGLPPVAELVRASLHHGVELDHYELHSWVIMPNHVHLLLTPRVSVSKLLCSLKAVTSKRANLLLKRAGEPFWQDESYDRLIRGTDEFRRIQRYIENNPVTAGLAATPEEYLWSSAYRGQSPNLLLVRQALVVRQAF